ncbi:BT1926 family outer membrane beta-barrel protein [Pontibacter populi]|uniref:BT1926 family outer membrane beta-barrel protein n=1 Tax=Pontibacter populi TaxID=890055 RepID=A0ABV1RS80_9BACT
MKNTLLTFILVLIPIFTLQAQDSSSEFKPVIGDRTIEAGSSLQGFQYGGTLKYRQFITDEKALRLSGNLQFSYNAPNDDFTEMYSAISIIPGIERHFAGTSRLSPYIGAELPLSVAFSKSESPEKTVNGAWGEQYNRAFIGAGLNAVTGVDFYIVKNFYVGLEFGAGVFYRKYKDVKIDYKEYDFNDRTIKGGSSINFNTFATGGFRIGFAF